MVIKIDLKVVLFVVVALVGLYFIILYNNSSSEKESVITICGGVNNIECDSGYQCHLNGDFPNATGTCTKK